MVEQKTEQEETEVNHTAENLESVGQMIIGGLETVGGILTADPVTRAEGAYNLEAGELHQEANKNLTAIDKAETDETNES